MKLIGQGNVYEGKSYNIEDSNGKGYATPAALGYPDNWYGGMVKKIFTAKDGVLMLCDKKDNIINIGVPDTMEDIPNSIKATTGFTPIMKGNVLDDKSELIELAKSLGIKGNIPAMKEDTLLRKIEEAQEKNRQYEGLE